VCLFVVGGCVLLYEDATSRNHRRVHNFRCILLAILNYDQNQELETGACRVVLGRVPFSSIVHFRHFGLSLIV